MSARVAFGVVLCVIALMDAAASLYQARFGWVLLLPGRPRKPWTAEAARQGGWVGFAIGVFFLLVGLSWISGGTAATILGAAACVLLLVGGVVGARSLQRGRRGPTT